MKKIITTTLFFLCLLTFSAFAQETLNETLVHDNVTREYIVYVPASYDGSEPIPLLFNFHGFTMTANAQMTWGGDMRPVADSAQFILVYPQGTDFFGLPHWNVGSWTASSTADDLGFTGAMIDALDAEYNIDLSRVYSCGYSNGGYFSFELACQMSDRIAAIGAVGGTMSGETYDNCSPTHPTPVITIHGTSDPTVSYNGGSPASSQSVDQVTAYWSEFNNLDPNPIVSDVPNIDVTDGSTVERSSYTNIDDCTSVEHYKVIGGGHDWPGLSGNMDMNAGQVIWEFVSQYNLDGLIECEFTSSTDELALEDLKKNISIYPNPTSDFINIKMNFQGTGSLERGSQDYEIYSTLGNRLAKGTISLDNTVVDFSPYPNNIYILRIAGQSIRVVKTN